MSPESICFQEMEWRKGQYKGVLCATASEVEMKWKKNLSDERLSGSEAFCVKWKAISRLMKLIDG